MRPSVTLKPPVVLRTIEDLRERPGACSGAAVLVPTMGALHQGHLRLAQHARALAGAGGEVVVSIFVNPTQFGPTEDFDAYPRDLERDAALCAGAGVDVIFAPDPGEIYLADASIRVEETSLSRLLCGASRPGHFAGVCLVVTKLFHIVRPRLAVFGKKDYQQLAVIRRLVRDLNLSVGIVGIDTVRESDGLAMSSRNAYLGAVERRQAPAIRAALLAAHRAFTAGQTATGELLETARAVLIREAPLGRIDYLEAVDAESLQPVDAVQRPVLLAAAVFFGECRLIDNMELIPETTAAVPPGA